MADKPQSEQSRRRDRLSASLRENLKRRKAQARARSAGRPDADTAEKSLDSAGIANEKQTD
jgi:hypothetical protein